MPPSTPGAQAEHLPGSVHCVLAAVDGTLQQRAGVLNNLLIGLKQHLFIMRQTPHDFLKGPQIFSDKFDREMEACMTGKSALSYIQCLLANLKQNHEYWVVGHVFKCMMR